jgi:hypothetical protein
VEFKNVCFLNKEVLLHNNLPHNCILPCHVEELYEYCKWCTHDIVHRLHKGILYFRYVLALQYMLKCNAIVANKTVQPCLHRFSKLINVDILHWILFQSKNNVENLDKFIYSSKWSMTFTSLIFMKLTNVHLLYQILYISQMKV